MVLRDTQMSALVQHRVADWPRGVQHHEVRDKGLREQSGHWKIGHLPEDP
jgi:hypothetical protein